MPKLITITGPIAAGKNTVASLLAENYSNAGQTVVIVDVDDVADMIATPGAAVGLWSAAHEAHGALTAGWMRTHADVVIAIGPIYTQGEQDALFGALPDGVKPLRVLIDAPITETWKRVNADERRGASRQREFHESAYARYRSLANDIPRDLALNSDEMSAGAIAAAIIDAASRSTD